MLLAVIHLLRDNGAQVLEQVRRMLERLGLTLHTEKTRVVQANEGFDFLGVHFRLRPVRKKTSRFTECCKLWPSNQSMTRIKQKIRERIGRRYGESLEEMIVDLNPLIRGWNDYHTRVQPELKRFLMLNLFVWDRLRIFLKRKYSDQTRGMRRVLGNAPVRLGLNQFG